MGTERIRTTEEYIRHVTTKFSGRFKYPDTVFKGKDEDIEFECPDHGKVLMPAKSHKERGCKYCNGFKESKTLEQLITAAKTIHGNDTYDYSLLTEQIYKSDTVFTPVCPMHGKFETKITCFINQSHGCQECGIIKQTKSRSKSLEQFIGEAIYKWGKEHDYSNINYMNNHTNIEYKCLKTGFTVCQTPRLHLKHGCPHCHSQRIGKFTWESYVNIAQDVWEGYYLYPILGEFPGVDFGKEIDVLCPFHGIFTIPAGAHIYEPRGCNKCNGGVSLTHEEYVSRAVKKHGSKFQYLSQYSNAFCYMDIECPKHGKFTQQAYTHLQSVYGCPKCASESKESLGEREVCEYIKSLYVGTLIKHDREVLKDLKKKHVPELDIFLPSLKLAFEYCGMFWHGEQQQPNRNYHYRKTKECNKNDIRLIHIYEYEWEHKKEIVKSRISGILGRNSKIPARKTTICKLTYKEKNDFLNETHIQGSDLSQIYLGLRYNDKIVACMTFGSDRFKSGYEWELLRFSSSLYTNIIGGASKLLNHFRNRYDGSIVSYADKRWSNGNLYYKLGFTLDRINDPSYHYYNFNKGTLHSRHEFQKHKLKDVPYYDDNLTEYEIMQLNGYERIWDCGTLRFTLE